MAVASAPSGSYAQFHEKDPAHVEAGYGQAPGYPQGYGAPAAPGYPAAGGPAYPGYPPAAPAAPYAAPGAAAPGYPAGYVAQPVAVGGYGQPGKDGSSSSGSYLDSMEAAVRSGFVRKVFGLLGLQLLVTTAIAVAFIKSQALSSWVVAHPGLLWASYAMTIVCLVAMACCGRNRQGGRSHAFDLAMLGIFTVCEAVMVGAISSTYNTELVAIAFGITCGIVLALGAFAWQTRIDFTVYRGMLCSLLWGLIFFGIFTCFFRDRALLVLYSSLGAIVAGCYFVVDVQLVIKKSGLSVDDYAWAALQIYVDIITIFLRILSILGASRR